MTSPKAQSSHLFWVHCNRCAVGMFSASPQSGPARMVITSCGCIFCLSCSGPATQAGCVSCGARTAKTLPLGKSLPPQVMEMFNSNLGSLGKLNKRNLFQSRQIDKTAKLMMNMEKKRIAKITEEAGPEVIDELDKELERLQGQLRESEAENERLEARMSQKRGSQQRSAVPVTPHNPIPGRRSLAQPPRVAPAAGQTQSEAAWKKGDFTKNKLF